MNIKVLIVEDNPITALDLQDILELKGFRVTVANNYAEALEMFHLQQPEVMLVDVNLKEEKDGIELVKELNRNRSIPVVYLTANSDEATRLRAINSGASSFLTKPFRDPELTSALEIAFSPVSLARLNSGVKRPYIFFRSVKSNKFQKVNFDEVMYLKAEGSYTYIVTQQDKHLLSNNLIQILGKILNKNIVRVHRSWAVNMNVVDSVSHDSLQIGSVEVPIGRTFRDEINQIITRVG